MINEIRRTIRSYRILGYYLVATVVDVENDMLTGVLYAISDENQEIPIFETETPVARQIFLDEMASLETRLQQPWFNLPADISPTVLPDEIV